MLRQTIKRQLIIAKFIALAIALGAVIFIQPNPAQAQKKKTTVKKTTSNSAEIISQTTDISAAAQKSCKRVQTIDDSGGNEFDLMCGGTGGYNFYFWIDPEDNKPFGWGYVRNAKIPNFYPLLAMGTNYLNEEEEDGDLPNEREKSDATRYHTYEYKARVGDKIEWFMRGGKVLAYAIRVFYFKDPDDTLTFFDTKKADAEFIFVRGVGDYESLEHDLNVRAAGGKDEEQALALVKEYFAKKK